MWHTFLRVIHLSRVTHFTKNSPFLEVWPIFLNLAHFFPRVIHFSKCDPILQVWPIFPSVTLFSPCNPLFLTVAPFSKCDLFFPVLPILKTVTLILSVTHYFQCDFFQVWPISLNVTFSKFLKLCPMFRSVTHFCERDLFFQVGPNIFLSIILHLGVTVFPTFTHFCNFDPSVLFIFPSVA